MATTVDYVVIGAGSAGCAVAGRLAESGDAEVAVLEAGGPDDHDMIHIPAGFPNLFKTEYDWDYQTEPQAALGGRADYWPRGRTYGGSGSINAQVVQRGAAGCYDGWADGGNAGWGWADVLPVFRRLEHNERGESEWHGVGGPMNVADQRDPNPLSRAFVEAAVEQGYARNADFNAASQLGFGLFQVNQKDGMRWSPARGYLHPVLGKENLTAVPHAQVTRLIFDGSRCTGAAYRTGGEEQVVTARREVVLCAGAVGSPQLLLLSGVGPRAQLEALGIAVVRDLPGVGENLLDHMWVPVAHRCTEPITMVAATDEAQLQRFAAERMGLLTSNIAEAGGFVQLDGASDIPDLQFHFGALFYILHGAVAPEGHGFSLFPSLVQPRSVGRLELRSADPAAKPVIDPRYLSDEGDLAVLVEGVRIARTILRSSALDSFRGDEVVPGDAVRSDDELADYVRAYAHTLFHPVGTCRMGVDAGAVVDAELRVRGVDGLRVADASVMPTIVNANTNFPSIMIGEKCAELVRSA
jgi:choline dehydrogenase